MNVFLLDLIKLWVTLFLAITSIPSLSMGLRCFLGQSDKDYPPKRYQICPRRAQFCYKTLMPHHILKYEWGCANKIGCMQVGCENIPVRILNEQLSVCCCNHNLCNSVPSNRVPQPPVPLLLAPLLLLLHIHRPT